LKGPLSYFIRIPLYPHLKLTTASISVFPKVSSVYSFNMKRLYMDYAVEATFYFQAVDILNNPA
jgi:hypothetical protein